MGPIATLTLFPPHSLDTSVLAAVVIAVFILAFFTETLGWVFVGLVVPGYLASVFVIRPEAGVTVVVEAILTYLLAVILARGVSATGAWSEFFGRERFFLIVICSVLVRALSEVVLLPRLGVWLDASFGTTLTIDRALHSVGLVLVPLTANALWKIGLRRGLWQVGLPTAMTFAILWYVLLPYTNLTFNSLELTYEDVAQRFLASPKAYIILLATALFAARFNLRYGWDFNGILVAALVALTWLGPAKLLATVVEVLVLVAGTRGLLALPGLRTMNLEGPRKTVLVFALAFALKFILGWALGGRIPGLKVTDLFGFGYLVPTLLTLKILQKQATARVLLPTLHTSLAGVVVGSLIGFPLSFLERGFGGGPSPAPPPAITQELHRTALGVMALARATCRENDSSELRLRRRRGELRVYERLWSSLDEWLRTRDEGFLAQARSAAAKLGLELEALDPSGPRQGYALFEPPWREPAGWGAALLFPGSPGPVLEVPRPTSESPSAEAAAILCERIQCRAVIVSGVDTRMAAITRGDALHARATPLQSAHAALGEVPRLQIRADASAERGRATLHVGPSGERPPPELWPGAAAVADAPPEPGRAWYDGTVSVLRAHPEDLIAAVVEKSAPEVRSVDSRAVMARLARTGSAPVPSRLLSRTELLVLQQQVAEPLLGSARDRSPLGLRVRWAAAMGSLLGLRVERVEGWEEATSYLVIGDEARPPAEAGALIRPGGAPLALEVPLPVAERGTLEIALETWRTTSARALVFSDPIALPNGAAPATPGALRTPFHALHQAVHRALGAPDALFVQLRGFAARPGVSEEILVTLDGAVLGKGERPAVLEKLWGEGQPFGWLKGRVRYHDGTPELAGLTTPSPQHTFSRTFDGPPVATLWFSEAVRGAFVPPRSLSETLALAELPPLPLPPRAPAEALTGDLAPPTGATPERLWKRFRSLSDAAERLVRQRGVHDLRALADAARLPGAQAWIYESPEHALPYVVVEARDGSTVLRGLYFLQESLGPSTRRVIDLGESGIHAALVDAVRRRAPAVVRGKIARAEARR